MEQGIGFHEDVPMPEEDFPVWAFYYEREAEAAEELFGLHWHEHVELIHIVEGRMTVECDGKQITAVPGDDLIFSANELHCCPAAMGHLRLYCVIFDVSLLNSRYFDKTEIQYISPILNNRISFHHLVHDEPGLGGYIIDICREMEEQRLGYELAAKADLLCILVLLLRGHIYKIMTPFEKSIRQKNNIRIDEVLRYIHENYREEISIEALADSIYISKFYLCKLFKKLIGKTITEYINQIRINAAEKLLQEGNLSVSETAGETGFSDINYFSRLFKRHIGISPSEFKKKNNETK